MTFSFLSSLFSPRSIGAEFCHTWDGHYPPMSHLLEIIKKNKKSPDGVLLAFFGQINFPKIIQALGNEFDQQGERYKKLRDTLINDTKVSLETNYSAFRAGRHQFLSSPEYSWNKTDHAIKARENAIDACHNFSIFLLTSGCCSELWKALDLKESSPLVIQVSAQMKEDDRLINTLFSLVSSQSSQTSDSLNKEEEAKLQSSPVLSQSSRPFDSLNKEEKVKFELTLLRNVALIEIDRSSSKPLTWLDVLLEWREADPTFLEPILAKFKLMHIIYTADDLAQRVLQTNLSENLIYSFKSYLIYKTIAQFKNYCPLPKAVEDDLYQLFQAFDKDRKMACFYFSWLLKRLPARYYHELIDLTLDRNITPYQKAIKLLDRFFTPYSYSSPSLQKEAENTSTTRQFLRKMAFVAIFDFFTGYNLKSEDKASLFRWIHEEPRPHLWLKYFDHSDQALIQQVFQQAYQGFSKHCTFQDHLSIFYDLVYIHYFLNLQPEEIEFLSIHLAQPFSNERTGALKEVQHYGISIGLGSIPSTGPLPDSPHRYRMDRLESDFQEYTQFNPSPSWQPPCGYASTIVSFLQLLEAHYEIPISLEKLIKMFCHPFFTLKRIEFINRLKPRSNEDRAILFDLLHDKPPSWLKNFDTLQHIRDIFSKAYQNFPRHLKLEEHQGAFADLIYILYFLDLHEEEIAYLSLRLAAASPKEREDALQEIQHYGTSLGLLRSDRAPSQEGEVASKQARQRRFSIGSEEDQERSKLPELPYEKRKKYLRKSLERYSQTSSLWPGVLRNFDQHRFPTLAFIQAFEECSGRELPLDWVIKMLCYPLFSNTSVANIRRLMDLREHVLENARTLFVPDLSEQISDLMASFRDSDVIIQFPGTESHAATFAQITGDLSHYLYQSVLAPAPYNKMIKSSSMRLFSANPDMECLQNRLSFYSDHFFNDLVYLVDWEVHPSPALKTTFLFSLEQPKSVSIRVPLERSLLDVLRNKNHLHKLFCKLLEVFIHDRPNVRVFDGAPSLQEELRLNLRQFPKEGNPIWEQIAYNPNLMAHAVNFFQLIKEFKIQARLRIASLFAGENLPKLTSQDNTYIPLFQSSCMFNPSDWKRLADMMYSEEGDIFLPTAVAIENSHGNIDVMGISCSTKEVRLKEIEKKEKDGSSKIELQRQEGVSKRHHGSYLQVTLWIPDKYSYTFHIQKDRKTPDRQVLPLYDREKFVRILYHTLCWQLLMIKNQLFDDREIRIRVGWDVINERCSSPYSGEGTVELL
ncbi:MAG: hypothetical protein ACSNEK_06170 [Parachlamydiaceae bacterium]